jgi:hypothetical protein
VANINWNSTTKQSSSVEHIVKVEVWDVVDRSKKKRNLLDANTTNNKNSKNNGNKSYSSSSTSNQTSAATLKLDNSVTQMQQPSIECASLDAEFIE